MASGKGRKRTTTTIVEDDPPPASESEGATVTLETGDTMETDAIAELLALGGGDGVKWTVKRVSAKPGQQSGYCATYTSGELSLDVIRDSFGGGKYAIRGTDAAGRYVAASTVEIVDLPKQPQAAAAPAAPPPQDFAGIAALLAAIKPATDSNAEMMKLLTAIVTRPAPPPPPQMSVTEIVALVKSLQGDGKSATESLLEGLRLGRELASGGGETGMMDIAARGLEMIAPLVAREAAKPPAPPRPRPQPAPTLPPAAPPAAPETPDTGAARQQLNPPATPRPEANPMLRKLNWLATQVRALVYQASRDADPEVYAYVLLDNLPDFISEDEILERFNTPGAIDQLAQFNPQVANYRPWFEKFRESVLAQLADDDEADTQAPPTDDMPGGDLGQGGPS